MIGANCMTPRACRRTASSTCHLALELSGQGRVVQRIRELRLQRLERHRVVALQATLRPQHTASSTSQLAA